MTRTGRTRPLAAMIVAATLLAGCSLFADDGEVLTEPGASGSELAGGVPEVEAAPPVAEQQAADAAVPVVFLRETFDDVITDEELAALRELPGVAEATSRRTDDGALWGSARSDGTPVDDLPEDFKISVALEVDRPELPVHPGPGEVVLTAAGARFRDLDVGGSVRLTDEEPRRVVAITDAPVLQDVEFVVAREDADALGIRGRQRAVLQLEEGADPDAVVAAATEALGPGTIAQVRVPDGRAFVLSLPATKERFGEFAFKDLPGRDVQIGKSWIDANVADERIPVIGRVICHRLIMDDLIAVMEDLEANGLAGEIDPDLYGGCWAPRRINKNANLSRHAWGIGIDVNVDFSQPGGGPIPSDAVIEAFERHGFRWGGEYPVPDNHHFEWVGPE